MTTIPQKIHEHYRLHPDRSAVVLQHAGQPDRDLAYGQLVRGAAAFAVALEAAGIQPGEVVILILQHGRDLVCSFYGAMLHGAIPSIMPFLTEKLLPERYRADLASLVGITRPAAILTYAEFEEEVRAALRPDDSVRAVIIADHVSREIEPDWATLHGMSRDEDEIALLQHSSGTTGLQKGVALSHRAIFNQLDAYADAIRLTADDVIVSWLPLYHDMGLIAGFLQPVLMGVRMVLMSPFDWVKAPYRLMQAVSTYKGTLSWLPNFSYNFCAQKIRDRHLEGVDLSTWRTVINCSEPVRHESHRAFAERFAPYGLKSTALGASYAMAENVFAVTQGGVDAPLTVLEFDRDAFLVERVVRPPQAGKPSTFMPSCGKPIRNTQVKVIGRDGQELPERQVGELALQSDCMLTGYYNRPEETEKAFLDGWYLTGDYGFMCDGEVYVSGRKKDLIIVAGKNVYPQDLERLAMETPGVHAGRVAAFGIFNDESGTEDVVIVAEVESEDPAVQEQIADGIRASVNRGSAIALRDVYLVTGQWLVKTSSGKTARLANRDKYLRAIAGLPVGGETGEA